MCWSPQATVAPAPQLAMPMRETSSSAASSELFLNPDFNRSRRGLRRIRTCWNPPSELEFPPGNPTPAKVYTSFLNEQSTSLGLRVRCWDNSQAEPGIITGELPRRRTGKALLPAASAGGNVAVESSAVLRLTERP